MLNATTGSTLAARQAGAATAIAAVAISTTGTRRNVIGSIGCTPNRNVEIDRLGFRPARDRAPTPLPMTARGAGHHQPQHMGGACTECDTHAELARALLHRVGEHAEHADESQSSASSANAPTSTARKRCLAVASVRMPVSVRNRSGRSGSTRAIAARTAGAMASAGPFAGWTTSEAAHQVFCAIGT